MNILVVRFSALGDVAMALPAVYSAALSYPRHTFHVLTTVFCARLFVRPPANIVMHATDDKTLSHVEALLASAHIDAVADLHNVLRSWLIDLHYLVRGVKVAMLDKRRRERLAITQCHKATARPFTLRYFDVFARLGLPCAADVFTGLGRMPLPAGLSKSPGRRWVGVAPFARYRNKTYPLSLMRKVVTLLSARSDVEVLLFGGRGREADELLSWSSPANVRPMAGRFPLDGELAVMSHLDVMVSMDSSNMHMASLVGVRVVSVWGATTPACGFLGWGQRAADAVVARCDCQPCSIGGGNKCPYGDYHCLTAIQPEQIAEKVWALLQQQPT